MTTPANHNLFIEQAEYLEPESFSDWVIEHPHEEVILRKLTQAGAKLLTGPRGCGKTTLLLKAYRRMLRAGSSALPIYVNFKSSLKLEPLYKSNANAVYWFNQWLILKVYQGLYETLDHLNMTTSKDLQLTSKEVNDLAGQLELGQTEFDEQRNVRLAMAELEDDIEHVLLQCDRSRCILLLDFFEFFRNLKSRAISPKAAIYPGVTVYSPTFHVGHDAEEIDIWLKPHGPEYLGFMTALLAKRLPADVYNTLKKEPALLQLLCYAAFGMPRALLNMVRSLYSEGGDNTPARIDFTRTSVLQAVKGSAENTIALYASLRFKLPMYANFVVTGEQLFQRMITGLKQYNRAKETGRQSVTAAMQRPIPSEVQKVLGFFQYAGLLLPRGDVSRGEKGVFDLYLNRPGNVGDSVS
jgi:energy-coupling factor transporter ATP-binding protein EcfA2